MRKERGERKKEIGKREREKVREGLGVREIIMLEVTANARTKQSGALCTAASKVL